MNKTKQLTQRQKDTLKRHSKHHTAKHMAEMKRLMRRGKTFTESHKIAMKKVGKWKVNFEQYYLELSIFIASVLAGLALKDYSISFIKGLKFKLNSQFNEGEKVILDGEQAMIIKIGLGTTIFGVYGKDGYTWRYISNNKIESLKLEKIVDKDLHADTIEEKKLKLEKILRGDKDVW